MPVIVLLGPSPSAIRDGIQAVRDLAQDKFQHIHHWTPLDDMKRGVAALMGWDPQCLLALHEPANATWFTQTCSRLERMLQRSGVSPSWVVRNAHASWPMLMDRGLWDRQLLERLYADNCHALRDPKTLVIISGVTQDNTLLALLHLNAVFLRVGSIVAPDVWPETRSYLSRYEDLDNMDVVPTFRNDTQMLDFFQGLICHAGRFNNHFINKIALSTHVVGSTEPSMKLPIARFIKEGHKYLHAYDTIEKAFEFLQSLWTLQQACIDHDVPRVKALLTSLPLATRRRLAACPITRPCVLPTHEDNAGPTELWNSIIDAKATPWTCMLSFPSLSDDECNDDDDDDNDGKEPSETKEETSTQFQAVCDKYLTPNGARTSYLPFLLGAAKDIEMMRVILDACRLRIAAADATSPSPTTILEAWAPDYTDPIHIPGAVAAQTLFLYNQHSTDVSIAEFGKSFEALEALTRSSTPDAPGLDINEFLYEPCNKVYRWDTLIQVAAESWCVVGLRYLLQRPDLTLRKILDVGASEICERENYWHASWPNSILSDCMYYLPTPAMALECVNACLQRLDVELGFVKSSDKTSSPTVNGSVTGPCSPQLKALILAPEGKPLRRPYSFVHYATRRGPAFLRDMFPAWDDFLKPSTDPEHYVVLLYCCVEVSAFRCIPEIIRQMDRLGVTSAVLNHMDEDFEATPFAVFMNHSNDSQRYDCAVPHIVQDEFCRDGIDPLHVERWRGVVFEVFQTFVKRKAPCKSNLSISGLRDPLLVTVPWHDVTHPDKDRAHLIVPLSLL